MILLRILEDVWLSILASIPQEVLRRRFRRPADPAKDPGWSLIRSVHTDLGRRKLAGGSTCCSTAHHFTPLLRSPLPRIQLSNCAGGLLTFNTNLPPSLRGLDEKPQRGPELFHPNSKAMLGSTSTDLTILTISTTP